MADTICASQGPHTQRLRPDLLYKQQVAASKCTVITDVDSPSGAECAQGVAQLIIDAVKSHWHLDLLGRDERDVHIRAIPHKGKPGRAFNGNFAMDLENFQAHNNTGHGLYLQPSIGGTLRDEVKLCPALFWEYDDRARSEQVERWKSTVGLKPTFQTDTQGKSIHNWLVLETPMDPEPWTLLMERLQQAAPGCDKNCKGTNRMMRMAGSHYINRNGEYQGLVQIINADGPRYSAEELDAVLPPLPSAPQFRRKKYRKDLALGLVQIADALKAGAEMGDQVLNIVRIKAQLKLTVSPMHVPSYS